MKSAQFADPSARPNPHVAASDPSARQGTPLQALHVASAMAVPAQRVPAHGDTADVHATHAPAVETAANVPVAHGKHSASVVPAVAVLQRAALVSTSVPAQLPSDGAAVMGAQSPLARAAHVPAAHAAQTVSAVVVPALDSARAVAPPTVVLPQTV